MMIDDITSLVGLLIINQLQNLLMPKLFGGGLLIKGHFELSTKSIGRSTYLAITIHYFDINFFAIAT
jgi:hypothetical protein